MGIFGSLGKSISKGFSAGNHGPLGPIGGAFSAFGSGMKDVFGAHPMQSFMPQQPMGMPQQDDENDPLKQQQKQRLMQLLMQGGRF